MATEAEVHLIGNGSLAPVPAAANINKIIPVTTGVWQLLEVVASIRASRGYRRELIREFERFIRKRIRKAVQKLYVQLWNVRQRKTEAEEVTDS
jgi:hypothetical protein